jgi:asparagine synthase (glutamine-hydrolysing)
MIARGGDAFYFASEAKAILATGELAAVPNLDVLGRFLGSTYPFDVGDTVFEGIDLLPAAHNLVVTANGVEQSRYWSYRERENTLSEQQAEESFRSIFTDAVRLRLRADVPVGVLLSGGLDSSSIAVNASRQAERPLPAFTATFPGYDRDESRYAGIVAEAAGMPHHPVAYDPSTFIEDADALVWHLETPLTDPQVFPRWRMLSAASRRVTVVLEGQGADELLAGYDSRYLAAYRGDEQAAVTLRDFIPRFYRLAMTAHWLRKGRRAFRSWLRRGEPRVAVGPETIRARTLAAAVAPSDPDLHFADGLTTLLAYDHSSAMLPNLLNYGDRIAMAHAVESRLPFLDHRLVELVFSLPFDAKMRAGVTKYILRRSIGPDLPPQILARRRKIGFSTPYAGWVDRHYARSIRPLLVSQAALDRPIFDADGLRRLVDHYDETRTGGTAILRAYSMTRWYQRFVDRGHR